MSAFSSKSAEMRYAVGVCRYGVSLGRAGADWLALEGVALEGVSGAVSVRADMGVLCLLDERRSRALALPVPFLDAGAMIGLGRGFEVWYARVYPVASSIPVVRESRVGVGNDGCRMPCRCRSVEMLERVRGGITSVVLGGVD
jgi:hypothetical protein